MNGFICQECGGWKVWMGSGFACNNPICCGDDLPSAEASEETEVTPQDITTIYDELTADETDQTIRDDED